MTIQIKLDANTRYAGFWRRAAASLIDTLLLMPLLAIILYLLYGPAYFEWYATPHAPFESYGSGAVLVNQLLPIALIVFFWVKFLGTPGKLLLDCYVVHAQTGKPLGAGRALLRYLGYYVSALPLMLGFLWVAWDKRKQGFHDKIANSVVVIRDESGKTLEELREEYGEDFR
ncbi:MAG: RDD family protein [Pseudomonadota bacterium]